ncbi:MAG TPA: hypothetical protein VE998_13600, partial [Terriglobales bacterium]|nr:hypothetical protein [Terriglobales bacterium]
CGAACTRAPGPPRPAGVPNEAVWVQGASQAADGRFVTCTVEPARNVNRCRVYHASGKLDCERDFRLQPGDRAARRTELDYSAWAEGQGILLRDGRKLEPLMACDVDD